MNSVEHMISRYQKRCHEEETGSSQGVASKVMGINNEGTRFRSCSQLQESIKSMEVMLSRYHRTQAGERTSQGVASKDTGDKNQVIKFRTCKELLELVERVDENPNAFSVSDIKELLEELTHALKETRSRQMDLQMEKLPSMHIQDTKLTQGNEELKQQVASARKQKGGVVDDGGEGPDAFATNQCYQSNPPKELERKLMEENEQLKQQVASAAGKQKDVTNQSTSTTCNTSSFQGLGVVCTL